MGHEPAEEIVELGQGATTRKVGDRVGVPWLQSWCSGCEWCQRGKSFFCLNHIATGINIAGSHAEYVIAYADATQLIPNGLSYNQAAPIFCAGYTIYSALGLVAGQHGDSSPDGGGGGGADVIKGLRPDGV